MAKALSVDLQDRVVAAVDDGLSRRQAAKRFLYCEQWDSRRREVAIALLDMPVSSFVEC
jgi:hypothetical protein